MFMFATVKRILKILGWIAGIIVLLVVGLVVYILARWDAKDPRLAPSFTAPRDSAAIARGEYIFKYQAQCWGCHANNATDANSPPSGGLLFDLTHSGPGFGKWYSANLTPDPETGLGTWTDGEIVQALREGVRKDRTTLFPVMPVDWYNGIADEDILALVAYLRSIPAVKKHVPKSEPSFVAKALFTFKLVKPKDPIPSQIVAPHRDTSVAYGRYLANNLGGCADCHTPRSLQDGHFFLDSLFAGSSFAFGADDGSPISSYARNITPDAETGIGSWTEEQFLTAVTAGNRPDGTALSPHMPYAYYKSWSPEDLRALFAYLKNVPARKRVTPTPAFSQELKNAQGAERGKLLFNARCTVCHGINGSGAQPTAVKLAEVVESMNDADLRDFMVTSQPGFGMPAFGKTLSDSEMNDLIAFMRTWAKK